MYSRFRETRNQFLHFPNLQQEWRETQPRYFLRKDGSVTDKYWHVWTNTFFRFYAKMPTFVKVFEFAADEGLLHPEFAAFFHPVIEGRALSDPARRA